MRTLYLYSSQNSLGAVPAGAIITGASNVISSIFGNSAAKKASAAQTSFANSQASIALSQERQLLSNQNFELSKFEISRKEKNNARLMVFVGITFVVAAAGAFVFLARQKKQNAK